MDRFLRAKRIWCSSKDHAEFTLSKMESYFLEDQMTDVVVIAGDRRIRAHKLVLSAGSEYFANMFEDDLQPTVIETELYNIDGDAVWALLNYLYTGKIELVEDTVETLLETSCRLLVGDVFQACSEFIKNRHNPSNCTDVSDVADSKDGSEPVELSQKPTNTSSSSVRSSSMVSSTVRSSGADSHRKWHVSKNHAKSTLRKMTSYFLKGQLADFWITAGGRDIPTHKLVLSAGSKYYADMMFAETEITCVLGLDFPNIDGDAAWAVLKYFYTGMIQLEEDTAEKLLDAACILQAYDLIHVCREFSESRHNPYYCNYVPDDSDSDDSCEFFQLSKKFSIHSLSSDFGYALYVFGGGKDCVEKYDVENDKWTVVDEFKLKVPLGSRVVEADGKLYIVGGEEEAVVLNTVQCYDIERKTVRDLPPMGSPRSFFKAAILRGSLYVVGGRNSSGDLNTVERFNLKSETWSYVTPMSMNKWGAGVAVLNEKLYVVGGYNKDVLATVECYDPHTNKWMPCASMTTPRSLVGVGVLGPFLFAVGCLDDERHNSKTVERYDPRINTWTKVASMNYDRWGAEVSVLGGKLFAVGGAITNLRNEVEVYDTGMNEWREVAPLNVGRASPCVMVMKL